MDIKGVIAVLLVCPGSVLASPQMDRDIDRCVERYMRENAYRIHWSEKREAREAAYQVCERYVPLICQDRDSEKCKKLLGESRSLR